jgi:hypothetical protein
MCEIHQALIEGYARKPELYAQFPGDPTRHRKMTGESGKGLIVKTLDGEQRDQLARPL